jgi:hypothetical protein
MNMRRASGRKKEKCLQEIKCTWEVKREGNTRRKKQGKWKQSVNEERYRKLTRKVECKTERKNKEKKKRKARNGEV